MIAFRQNEFGNSGAPSSRSEVFYNLDGLRGVAAIAVVAWHANQAFEPGPWLSSAYLAVDMFFVLSGFVLAHAYLRKFEAGMTVRTFMQARLIRLYPLYFLSLCIFVIGVLAAWEMGRGAVDTAQFTVALPLNALFLPILPVLVPSDSLFPLNAPRLVAFL